MRVLTMAMGEGVDDLKTMWQELKAHVERLAAERRHYLEIFERADEAYLVTNAEGIIEDVNGAAVDLLERRRRHLRGRPIASLVAPRLRPEFKRRLDDLVAGTPDAASWSTQLVDPARGEIRVGARLMGRPAHGISWLLRPAQ